MTRRTGKSPKRVALEKALRLLIGRAGFDVDSICRWINEFGNSIDDDDLRTRLRNAAYTVQWYVGSGRGSGTLAMHLRRIDRKQAIGVICDVAAGGVTVADQANVLRSLDHKLQSELTR